MSYCQIITVRLSKHHVHKGGLGHFLHYSSVAKRGHGGHGVAADGRLVSSFDGADKNNAVGCERPRLPDSKI